MRAGDFFAGVLLGAVVGAAVGLLLAPQSGEETREAIKTYADDLGEKVKETGKQLGEKTVETGRQLIDSGKDMVEKGKAQILAAVKKEADVASATEA